MDLNLNTVVATFSHDSKINWLEVREKERGGREGGGREREREEGRRETIHGHVYTYSNVMFFFMIS